MRSKSCTTWDCTRLNWYFLVSGGALPSLRPWPLCRQFQKFWKWWGGGGGRKIMYKHPFVCYFRCLMVKDDVWWCILMFQVSLVLLVDGLWQVKEAPKPDVFVEKATDTTGSRKFCHVFRGEICWLKSCSCTHVVYPSLSHDFYGFIPQVVQDFIENCWRSDTPPEFTVSKETIHSLANHGPWPNHG